MQAFAFGTLMLLAPAGAAAQSYMGAATVIDGDTIDLGGSRFKIFDIDAPEAGQTCNRKGQLWSCGEEASTRLTAMIAGTE